MLTQDPSGFTHDPGSARPRITGQDENGNDILGPAREIGAIWPRKNGKKGGIMRLDHVPAELALHQGVLFTLPVEDRPDQTQI